uniref:Cathepsin propeptide inhibitor domain-containing protein n=1 Tax=Leersia perrieri TaxID=77586 RepID=A0A0D9WB51_9ORYZ
MRRSAALLAATALLMLLVAVYMSIASYRLRIEEEETRQIFVEWKAKYDKSYTSIGEEEFRYAVFKKTRRIVDKHNAEADAGLQSYRVGLNIFADSTKEEMSRSCFIHGPEEEALLSSAKVCPCCRGTIIQAGGSTIPGQMKHSRI